MGTPYLAIIASNANGAILQKSELRKLIIFHPGNIHDPSFEGEPVHVRRTK